MNPLTLVAGIFHVISKLHDAHRQIKSNIKQSGTLIKRVAALLTPLKALEAQLDREEAQRMEAEAAADAGAGAGTAVGSTTGGTGPPLPPSSLSAASNASLVRQLSALLSLLDDAFALVSSFTAASSWSRVWSKSDYSESFLALHAALSQAQADLGFGMAVSDRAWNIQATRDAAEDLKEIKQAQEEMALQMQQARLDQQSHAASAASAAAAAAQRDASEHEFLVQRFQSMSAKQDEVVRLLARLEREQNRAEERSQLQQHQQPGSSASASPSPSPSSSLQLSDGILRFSLSDLELDPLPVGSGGFGDVFRAHCSSRDEIVAVKKLRVPSGSTLAPQALAEFMSELQLLHSLPRHAHIITLLGVVLDPERGVYAMVLEWMARGSLWDFLRSTPRTQLSYRDRLQLALQVTRALNHLHALPPPSGPIVHRDLKSLNILLDERCEVRLADFGLAKARVHANTASMYTTAVLSAAAGAGSTAAASTLGTLRWSAPEFLRPGGKSRGSTASDIYSVAVILWEIFAHAIPYEGDSDDLIALSIRSADMQDKLSLEGLPAKIAQILRACWALDQQARPTAAQVMGAIKSLLNEENARIEAVNAATTGEQQPSVSPSSSSPTSGASAGDRLRCVACHRLRSVALDFLQAQLRKPAGATCNECLMAKAERECEVACCSSAEPGAPNAAAPATTRASPSAAAFAAPPPASTSPSSAAPSSPFGFSEFLLRADSHPWVTPQVCLALDEMFVVTRSQLEVSVYALADCRVLARPQPTRVLRPGFSRIDAIVLDRASSSQQTTLFVSGKRQASDYLVRMSLDGSILHSAPCVYASSLALDAQRSTLFCASLAKVKVFDFAANPIGEFGTQAPASKKNGGAAASPGAAAPDAIGLAHQVLVLSAAHAATRVFVLDKDLHRVSVWDARNFKPLYSFGRPAAAASPSAASNSGSEAAGCCTFGNWSSAALLQNGANGQSVLVISEAASRNLSVYAASGEFLGSLVAHREERRQICADPAAGRELWEVYQLSAQESAEAAAAAASSPVHGGGGPLSPGGSAPVWTPDSLRSACFCCGSKFTLLRRRHHCRVCKEIVCGDCSKSKTAKTATNKSERMCDRCVAMQETSVPL